MKNGGMASGRPGETERRRTLNIRRLSHVKNRKTGLSVTVQKAGCGTAVTTFGALFSCFMKAGDICALKAQQGLFSVESAGVSRQTASDAHDAVAGNDDGNGIMADGSPHSLRRHGTAMHEPRSSFGKSFVGDDFSEGNAAKLLPYQLPEVAPPRGQRKLEG